MTPKFVAMKKTKKMTPKFVAMTAGILNGDWKPTDIKGERYQIYRNSDGVLTVFLDGKILPGQKDLTWNQKTDSAVEVTVTVLFQ